MKKNNRFIVAGALAAGCSMLTILGGCSVLSSVSTKKEELPVLTESLETGIDAGNYRPFTDINYYSTPDQDGKPAGSYTAGERIYLEGVAQYGTESWGKTSDDHWILVSDQQYTYLPREEDLAFEEKDADKDYESTYSGYSDCFLVPIADTKPASVLNVSKGDLVHVETTVTDGNGYVFGKLDKNKWILISKDGKKYFSPAAANKEEKDDSTDTSSKDDSQSVQIIQITPAAPTQEYSGNTVSSSEYILPYSNCAYLTFNDLYGLSKTEVELARNEIYARHGRMFNTDYIRSYFESKSWYHPTISPSNFSESVFNTYESENIKTIVSYETQMGWR